MMSKFTDHRDTSEVMNCDRKLRCSINIKNALQWRLRLDYLAESCSFRQAAQVMQSTKKRTGLAYIGSCTEHTISKYSRFASAINLQKLADLLEKQLGVFCGDRMSTHMSTGYLDIRIRLHSLHHGIVNSHVLAIPVFERHTGEVIFNTAAKAFDYIHLAWRDKIFGISTDGEKKMTRRISGVATRFQQVSKPRFIRVWCGAHQLDIVLQNVYSAFGDEEFYKHLTGKGPLSPQEADSLDVSEWMFSRSKLFATRLDKVHEFVFNQGTFVEEKLEGITNDELKHFIRDVGMLFVEAIDGVNSICSERDARNEAADESSKLPPVLPHEIITIRHSQFYGIVRAHRERLLSTWTPVDIDTLEQQHQNLQEMVSRESALKDTIKLCDDKTSFIDCWKILNGRFPLLERFCGGLATVFPGTSQVESDFSLVKGAKNIFKKSMTDLSLEGVFTCKTIRHFVND
eukprot:IDg6802t1